VELHRGLRHRNVVGFHSFFEDDTSVYMVLEFCSRKVSRTFIQQFSSGSCDRQKATSGERQGARSEDGDAEGMTINTLQTYLLIYLLTLYRIVFCLFCRFGLGVSTCHGKCLAGKWGVGNVVRSPSGVLGRTTAANTHLPYLTAIERFWS